MSIRDASRLRQASASFVSRDLERRNLVLDAFRGWMIIGMILVNHSPPTATVYAPLAHAPWHGWTFADTIFPGFLFAVGVSIAYSVKVVSDKDNKPIELFDMRALRRFAILTTLNFILVNFPYYFQSTVRLTGTLTLIACCYLAASLFNVFCTCKRLIVLLLVLLAVQSTVYYFLPAPQQVGNILAPESNPARHIDAIASTAIIGRDWSMPDGAFLVPALGAIATTLCGLLVGRWVLREDARPLIVPLVALGSVSIVAGSVWSESLPINKSLWTGSYAMFMAGVSVLVFAFLRIVALSRWRSALLVPLQIAGANALVFYVLAQGLQRILVYGRVIDGAGEVVRLRNLIYDHFVALWMPGEFGAFIYSVTFFLICYSAMVFLYSRRIFIKL